MAVIDTSASIPLAIRPLIAQVMWNWFDRNRDTEIFSKKVLFFTVSLKVHHIERLFVRLFGDRPVAGLNPLTGDSLA